MIEKFDDNVDKIMRKIAIHKNVLGLFIEKNYNQNVNVLNFKLS